MSNHFTLLIYLFLLIIFKNNGLCFPVRFLLLKLMINIRYEGSRLHDIEK